MEQEATDSFVTGETPPAPPSAGAIRDWLVAKMSEMLGFPEDEIDVRDPFANYGMSSMAAVSLSADLEDWLELRLPPTLAWDYPTVEALTEYLAAETAKQTA